LEKKRNSTKKIDKRKNLLTEKERTKNQETSTPCDPEATIPRLCQAETKINTWLGKSIKYMCIQ
jgi:hypothetical protein